MESNAVRFADAARTIGAVAAARGLSVPTFRSPPKRKGLTRTLRRRSDGSGSVAVALRGRPWVAVLADMLDGIAACNQLDSAQAGEFKDLAWNALGYGADTDTDVSEAA